MNVVAPVAVTALAACPDVPVKINHNPNEISTGNTKVCDREMDEDLPGTSPDAGNADVGEDNEEGSYHGEEGHSRHYTTQPDLLVLQRVARGAGVGPVVV